MPGRFIMVPLVALIAVLVLTACRREPEGVMGEGEVVLALHEPDDVTIRRGQTAEIRLMVRRENLTDPIRISFENLPNGVEAVDSDKQIVGDEGTYILEAGDDADLVEGHIVRVTAQGPDNLSHTEEFRIDVLEQE